METKSNTKKYIAIVLACIFLISAALLLVEMWDSKRGLFPEVNLGDDTISYKGKKYIRKDQIETFLVLGLDKYEGAHSSDSHESGVQADFLMLFVFDNEKETCTALQINRDTMTKINRLAVGGTAVVDTYTRQIALAYNYVEDDNDKIRCRNTKDSVEYLLHGIEVDHYLAVTMDAVPAINDLVGGVEVTVLDDFSGIDDKLIQGETVTLMGEQALRYVRSRKGLDDSTNNARMKRQQQYIHALYEKLSVKADESDEFTIQAIATVDEYVVYDSSNHKMQKMAEKFEDYEFLGIKKFEGELKNGEEFVEFYPDEDSVWEILIELFYVPVFDEK